jgi:hypothetical protein
MTAVKHEKHDDDKGHGKKAVKAADAAAVEAAKDTPAPEPVQWFAPQLPCTEGAIIIPTLECIDGDWVTGTINITELQGRLNGSAPVRPCKPCGKKAEPEPTVDIGGEGG